MGTHIDHNSIERMTWDEVARRIGCGAGAILPIGSAAKQHGLHLPLGTDRIQAEWLAGRIAEHIDALIWPTVTYGHYPAFVEYAGSVSLPGPLFQAMVREIVAEIVGHGCRAVFVLNTGISTLAPVGSIGAARCSACSPISKSASGRTTAWACRMPCAP